AETKRLTIAVRVTVAGSRPMASQCASRAASFRVTTGAVPPMLHRSASSATSRRVTFSPEPPIMIGMRRRGRHHPCADDVEVLTRVREGLLVEHAAADGDRLPQHGEALPHRWELPAVGLVLLLVPRRADAEDG